MRREVVVVEEERWCSRVCGGSAAQAQHATPESMGCPGPPGSGAVFNTQPWIAGGYSGPVRCRNATASNPLSRDTARPRRICRRP